MSKFDWTDQTQEQEPEVNYHARWAAFALRRNTALFLLYGWVPVSLALFYFSRHYFHMPILSLVIMFVWLALALAGVWWAGEFRCPRCRRRYAALGHRKGEFNMTRGIFDRICSNCKLRKFENG